MFIEDKERLNKRLSYCAYVCLYHFLIRDSIFLLTHPIKRIHVCQKRKTPNRIGRGS
jgi:hypothetical protein